MNTGQIITKLQEIAERVTASEGGRCVIISPSRDEPNYIIIWRGIIKGKMFEVRRMISVEEAICNQYLIDGASYDITQYIRAEAGE